MEVLRLKLEVEKGRKEREMHEFRAGSKIQIGRVGKINTLRIRDSGISSEHLLIELNNKNSKWVVSDLASFNGTFLNDVQLDPNKRHVLKNGDVIKIGEETTLKVSIEEEELKGKRIKRVKKTACRECGEELKSKETNAVKNVRRKRGRPRKGNVGLESEAVNRVSVGVADANVVERMSLEKEICAMPSTSEKEKLTRSKLEKMTLGQWFDHVEVYLVRQIRGEMEEIMKSMEARAEQYKEFMSQQNISSLA